MSAAPTPATLAPTALIDSDHPAVVAFARRATATRARERAVELYYLVRDQFRYDPYRIDFSIEGLRASRVVECGYGWCVPKAALLAAAARAAGIPARVGYADVRNHLSTERLRKILQTDLYVWHGYTELWLGGGWGQAEPVTAWRIIAAHTIDARIAELIDSKQGLALRALDGSDVEPGSADSVQLDSLQHLLRSALDDTL